MKVSLETKTILGINLLAGAASIYLKPKAGLVALISGVVIGCCMQAQTIRVVGTLSRNKLDEMMAGNLPKYGVLILSAAALCVTLNRIGISYLSEAAQSFLRQNMISLSTLVLGYYLGKCLTSLSYSDALPSSVPKDPEEAKRVYLARIERSPNEAENYRRLAALFDDKNEKIVVNNTSMGVRDLYVEAIRLDSNCANAYNSLATILELGETITLANGMEMGQKDLLLKAIDLKPNICIFYVNLGSILGDEIVTVNGREMNNFDLYFHAIALNPTKDFAYRCLADEMESASREFVEFNGKEWSQEDLYIKAIDCDPRCGENYVSLAGILDDDAKITLLDATEMTKQQLLLKSIEIDPTYDAYHDLLDLVERQGTIQLDDGSQLDQKDVLIQLIGFDTTYEFGYHALGVLLDLNEGIRLDDGTLMSKQELYLKAIECEPKYAPAYLHLACLVGSQGSIDLNVGYDSLHQVKSSNKFSWTQQQLFDKAQTYYLEDLNDDANDSDALWGLGNYLLHTDPQRTIRLLNGEIVTGEQLIQRAQSLHPNYTNRTFKV